MSAPHPAPLIPLPRPRGAGALDERDDEALMDLAAAERRPTFGVLVERYLPRPTNYCTKLVGSSRAEEEIAQEIPLEVWAYRRRYRSRSGFPVFLFTLARNRCLNQARREARRRGDLETAAPDACASATSTDRDQLDRMIEQERVRQVRATLLDLPDNRGGGAPAVRALLRRLDAAAARRSPRMARRWWLLGAGGLAAALRVQQALPDAVVLEDVPPGPLRIISTNSRTPLRVSAVESLPARERTVEGLRARLHGARVSELVVRVEPQSHSQREPHP